MLKSYSSDQCYMEGDRHWELAKLAHGARDTAEQRKQEKLAAQWYARARNGGWEEDDQNHD